MLKIKEGFRRALTAWKMTLEYFKANPNILIPFFIVGIFDFLILALIYLAPRQPLSTLLAPPIRAFWGEKFLHYPFNLLLIPRLFNYGHTISAAFTGVLMTGLAIVMLWEVKESDRSGVLVNLIRALKKYLSLVAIWLMIFALVSAVFRVLVFLFQVKPQQHILLQIIFSAAFLIGILIQGVFIYAMPAVMIERKKTWSAIKRSVSFFKEAPLATLILVALPMLTYVPFLILRAKLPVLMSRLFPEVVLIFLGFGIVISVITDCLITCSTAVLFLEQRKI